MQALRTIVVGWVACLLLISCSPDEQSDYDRVLTEISVSIDKLKGQQSDPRDLPTAEADKLRSAPVRLNQSVPGSSTQSGISWGRLAFLRYRLAMLTGATEDYQAAERAIAKANSEAGQSAGLVMLQAQLDYSLHRLDASEMSLQKLAASPRKAALFADIQLQRGMYAAAGRSYEQLLVESPSWDNFARLAYFRSHTGDWRKADRLYQQAADQLTAKQLQEYSWIELQRAILDLDQQHYRKALVHLQLANKAFSGYWLIEEHMAELHYKLGDTSKAIALYRELIQTTGKPELIGALASILKTGNRTEAEHLIGRAHRRYLEQYAIYPEAIAGHLAQFLLEHDPGNQQLLEVAMLNQKARDNAMSKTLLADSYRQHQMPDQASKLVMQIAASPWRTPEINSLLDRAGR